MGPSTEVIYTGQYGGHRYIVRIHAYSFYWGPFDTVDLLHNRGH